MCLLLSGREFFSLVPPLVLNCVLTDPEDVLNELTKSSAREKSIYWREVFARYIVILHSRRKNKTSCTCFFYGNVFSR